MADRYTKLVLTVIAIALTVIAVQNTRQATAQAGIQRVTICQPNNPQVCVGVLPFFNDGSGVLGVTTR